MTPDQKKAFRSLLLIAAVAALLPLPQLLGDSWPRTHERFAALERIEAFRRAFAAGIWYPVWTPFAGWGWGSPWPLFYHRLYPTLGALLCLATGSVLTSFKLLLVLLLFATGAGMRRLLRVAGVSEWLAVAGAVLLLASPYVLTDWIVRNAMAELTALALLPWLYAELALTAQGRARWIQLAAGMVLLFHAHSLICYFFLLSLVLFALLHRKTITTLARTSLKPLGIAIVIVLVGILPQVIVASDLMRYFNVEILTGGLWRVEANYHPIAHTFVDPFDWLTWQAEKISVELNRYVWLGLLLVIPAMVANDRARIEAPLHVFFAIWGTLCLLLQLPDFVFVFHILPKAEFLQFPWRLLSFLSIASIFVLMVWIDAAVRTGGRLRTVGILAAAGVVGLTLLQFGTVPYRRHGVESFSSEKLAAKVANLDGPNSFGEYLLPGMGGARPLPPPKQPIVKAACAPQLNVPDDFSASGLEITAQLDAPCEVWIRQFQTPLIAIEVRNGEVVSPMPSDEIRVVLRPGESSIRLRPRSFLELLARRLGFGA